MARKSQNTNPFDTDLLPYAPQGVQGPLSVSRDPGTDRGAVAPQGAFQHASVPGETIDLITVLYRDRRFAMEQRKRSDLAIGAYIRSALGWRKDLPEADRKAIAVNAAAVTKDPSGTKWAQMIQAQVASAAPFVVIEETALKQMKILAKTLPVWSAFGEGVRGFGEGSLATIVAEAGDLSNYATIPRLWKRMGLAVMGDVRQGGLAKGAGADAWIAHGYNPSRRSAMWNIGDTMLKAQVRKVKDDAGESTDERTSLGKYGELYLRRKEYELARAPDMPPIIAHRRAQRVMEKRLLKDIWQAWRRTILKVVEEPESSLSDAA